MMFHYDQCYYENPALGSTLYAIEVPDEGGNTLFANCRLAYEALDDGWKARLDGLRALHYYDYKRDPTLRPSTINPDAPQWVHPVVRTHPETGRKAIYVNRLMTLWIEGIDRAESDEILDYLFAHIEKPEFVYEHEWTGGRADHVGQSLLGARAHLVLAREAADDAPGDGARPPPCGPETGVGLHRYR